MTLSLCGEVAVNAEAASQSSPTNLQARVAMKQARPVTPSADPTMRLQHAAATNARGHPVPNDVIDDVPWRRVRQEGRRRGELG
jgi:hypothetical protein